MSKQKVVPPEIRYVREKGRVQRAGYRTQTTGAIQQISARRSANVAKERARAQGRIEAQENQTVQFRARRAEQLKAERQRRIETAVEEPVLRPNVKGVGIFGGLLRVFIMFIGFAVLYLVLTNAGRSSGAITNIGGFFGNITGTHPFFTVTGSGISNTVGSGNAGTPYVPPATTQIPLPVYQGTGGGKP